MPFPPFTDHARLRPVAMAQGPELSHAVAPFLAVEAPAEEDSVLALVSGPDRLAARVRDGRCWLEVTAGGRRRRPRRPRRQPVGAGADRIALTLTGSRLALAVREQGEWQVRAVTDLAGAIDVHDEGWLSALRAEGGALRGFGQLGLRDLRVVTNADGTAYVDPRGILLTATSAGPGFFDTAHASVWALAPDASSLSHLSDLFFRRPDRPGVYGDHACHLLRDGDRWLVATSTWGDFDPKRRGATVAVTLAESSEDLLTGRHVLDTRALPLPTTGFASVGVWDPHLVRAEEGWLVGYVSARRFFAFHPVLAAGPSLADLRVRGAATALDQTEGTTLIRTEEGWRLLASDERRRRYPVWDLDLVEVGALDAPYPSNIPWPTLVPTDTGWLQVCFDGKTAGGALPGYGTHGTVHVHRAEKRSDKPLEEQ